MELHIAPVLPTDFKQRVGDLPHRAHPHRIHQHFKHVGVVDHCALQAAKEFTQCAVGLAKSLSPIDYLIPMTPAKLALHKAAPKRLVGELAFKLMKRGKLPKPFHKMGSSRARATELISVSETHRVLFIWRDGELKTDAAFFAWLLCELEDKVLYPLFEFHCHPSHKGLHAKLPCKTDINYEGRQLPGAPELALSSVDGLDPRNEADRQQLISRFCKACGITMGQGGGLWN